jgi:pimeloyl-ACP methyl ester carboxylesterase
MNAPGRVIHATVCQAAGARGPGGSSMATIVRTSLTPLPSTFTASHRGGSGPPLVCLHGFTDTWRTWELVLPVLERDHEVLAPTLIGHAGGPPLDGPMSDTIIAETVERAMDEAGFETAHLVGNSLGGYLALQLAARGRARSVVALAPAGGWAPGNQSYKDVLAYFASTQEMLKSIAPHADAVAATPDGRRQATQFIATNFEHIPPDLVAHLIVGAAECRAAGAMIEHALHHGWPLDPAQITCPVRIVWGTADRVLSWPSAAAGYQAQLPHADWVELEGAGHCPQLDVPLETGQLIAGFT